MPCELVEALINWSGRLEVFLTALAVVQALSLRLDQPVSTYLPM